MDAALNSVNPCKTLAEAGRYFLLFVPSLDYCKKELDMVGFVDLFFHSNSFHAWSNTATPRFWLLRKSLM